MYLTQLQAYVSHLVRGTVPMPPRAADCHQWPPVAGTGTVPRTKCATHGRENIYGGQGAQFAK